MTKTVNKMCYTTPYHCYTAATTAGSMSRQAEDEDGDVERCRESDEYLDTLCEEFCDDHDLDLLCLDVRNYLDHDRLSNVNDLQENIERRVSKSLSGGKCLGEYTQTNKTSHFNGGSVVQSCQYNDYVNLHCLGVDNERKRYSSHFSGGGLISINDGVDYDDDDECGGLPTTSSENFDNDSYLSNTNPFRELICNRNNPFSESSLMDERSPSQCSTRPASPVHNNPFRASQTTLPTPSSFILALPILPVIPKVTLSNTSTQTDMENVVNNTNSDYDLNCLLKTMRSLKCSGWYYENLSWQDSVVLLKNTEPGTFLIRESSDPNFLFSLSVQTKRGPTSVRLHYINGKFRLDAEHKLIPHMPYFNSVLELVDYYIENTVKNKQIKYKKENKISEKLSCRSKEQVWIDVHGNVYSNILLTKPLYKQDDVLSLQHLSRLVINKQLNKNKKHVSGLSEKLKFRVIPVYNEHSPFHDIYSFNNKYDYNIFNENGENCVCEQCTDLPLPPPLINYLMEYPYCH